MAANKKTKKSTAQLERELERDIARAERARGIRPAPGATLRQRVQALEVTASGGSNRSGQGDDLDARMGLRSPAPRLGNVAESGGAVVQLPVMTPAQAREARANLEQYRQRYGFGR